MAKIQRLGVDLDGVVADFCHAHAMDLATMFGDKLPPGWATDYDKAFPVWAWEYHHGYTPEQVDQVWDQHNKSLTFWETLRPYPWTGEFLMALDRLTYHEGKEVIFITNRRGFMVKRQTEHWLQHYGIAIPTVVLARYKTPVIESLGIDFFIDDKPDTISSLITSVTRDAMFADIHPTLGGRFSPVLKDNIYLMDAPYNRAPGMRLPGTKVVTNPIDALKESGLL